MLCFKCNERNAVVFISNLTDPNAKPTGYCMKCAIEMNLPQIRSILSAQGIDEDQMNDIEEMYNQMLTDGGESGEGGEGGEGIENIDGFEFGGAGLLPPGFLGKIFNGMFPVKPNPNAIEGGQIKNSDAEQNGQNTADGQNHPGKKAGSGKNGNAGDKSKKNKLRYLTTYCTNLTEKAREGKLDPIIGREKEINRAEQILSRRTKNNPCLIGEPGVGKTAIAEGIAHRIVRGNISFRLLNKQVYLMDLTALVAGTQFRGQFESRIKGLIEEVKSQGNIILFIDEVHTLVGAGDSEGSMSAANIMKPALSRGEIQVIGATTFNEYRKNIEKDSALERRFQPIIVTEPTVEETIGILKGIKSYYESHHKVKVSDPVIAMCARLSERYITDRYLPDKAIDLLDESCANRCLRCPLLAEYEKLNNTLKYLYDKETELEDETQNPNYEKIAAAKEEISKVKFRLQELEPEIASLNVEAEDVAKVIELWTAIPADKIQESEFKKLSELSNRLKEKVVGQDDAIDAVVKAIKRSRVEISSRRKPASFIFVGPTGVGKTELVKVLAKELFDSPEPLIRLDMSEYMEKHAVSRLIGSPPGYVGYDEAGQLTEKVRRKPYSVILFDEIEKAHPDVMNLLLQILDEGKITDSHGRIVNFENTVICMTSNAGSSDKIGIAGFGKNQNEQNKEKILRSLNDFLRPEFLGRVDEVVVFNMLTQTDLEKISSLMLDELKEPLDEKGIKFDYDDNAKRILALSVQGKKYGARDLRQEVRKQVEDVIAQLIVDRYENPPGLISLTEDEAGENKKLKIVSV
ncbi:MAG: ATP-dependent Clp protease ATP-binding subunit [Oscillospiraceae bacterium]|nr:ATP-dependent Clp protease ATP-binding subunit [Oscillospiraceae bacterium]